MQRAVAGGLLIAREKWWRGAGAGVAPSTPGGALHDLGDGVYLSNDRAVAETYARTRAGPTGTLSSTSST